MNPADSTSETPPLRHRGVPSPTVPPVARPVPWGGPVARIRASVTARRLVPTELALIATDVAYRTVLRLSPRRMAAAVAAIDTIVGGTPAETDLAELAVRHVTAHARGWELTWRPWQLRRTPVDGLDHFHAARATGRGVIISFTHLGPTTGWVVLGPLLAPVVLLTNDRLDADPPPGYWGYQLEHRRKQFRESGIERWPATGSALPVYKLLKQGGTAMLAADWSGDRRTTFLGRPVDMVDGAAHLAMRTGALIMPAAQLPQGRRWRIELRTPLDPRHFTDTDTLHNALAAIHETVILDCPEHLASPQWAWPGATRHGWLQNPPK